MCRSYAFLSITLSLTHWGCNMLIEDRFEAAPSDGGSAELGGAGGREQLGGSGGSGQGAGSGDGGALPLSCGVPNAPTARDCPEECDACSADNSVCMFQCHEDTGCKGREIVCPAGLDCRVECAGEASCQDASVSCSTGYACEVLCSGSDGCKRLKLDCGEAASCDLSCTESPNACWHAQLQCGEGACGCSTEGGDAPVQACASSCNCEVCR